MFGIDAGGTFIKFGNPETSRFEMFELPYTKDWLKCRFNGESSPILATGAGSRQIASWFPERGIDIVPELMATGLGGAYLAGLDACVVMNIGSGTPILFADRKEKKVTHISGTGLGSASLAGLAFFMTGITDPEKIEQEALAGNPEAVTLLISDIYPNPGSFGLPGDITASNFGKFQGWRMRDMKSKPKTADLLAGLHRMVGETLAVIGALACSACATPGLTLVITGGGTLNAALCAHLRRTFEYLQKPYIIPEKAEFGTLHGLFAYRDLL